MDVHEQSAMDLGSQAVSDRVTKQIVTIFSKTCNNTHYHFNMPAIWRYKKKYNKKFYYNVNTTEYV